MKTSKFAIFIGLSTLFHLAIILFLPSFVFFSDDSPLAGGSFGGGGGKRVSLEIFNADPVSRTARPIKISPPKSLVMKEKFLPLKTDKKPAPSHSKMEYPGPPGTGMGTGMGQGKGPGVGTGSGLSGKNSLLAQILERIERAKRYPLPARENGTEGRSLVRFQIDPSGQPAEIALKVSSNSPLLDKEALAVIHRAAPYPRYEDPLEIWIRFELIQ